MTATSYPAGPITPHGQYYKTKKRYPTVHLQSHDETCEFYLLGGESIPWPTEPECVRLTKNGIKGLIAPWRVIGQKGATEDGETFVDSLYDPAEPELAVMARGRDPHHLQTVTKHLVDSLDTKRTSRLTVTGGDEQVWFSDVRWGKTPLEPFTWGDARYQRMLLRLRIDSAFWRADADVATLSGGGFQCVNIGDQPMYRDYVCIGPGMFHIASEPGSDDMVTFGPLLNGQVVYLRTDPRKTTLVELTAAPSSPQDLTAFQQAVKEFIDFASGGNAPPLLQSILSLFGIQPPQGNLYSLLQGRFGSAAAIAPAPVSGDPAPVHVAASVTGGGSLISTGVPLRKYPL